MSSGIPKFRNRLAFRLTLWYAGIFTFCSCIAFLLFYALITSVIRDRTDQELLGQVRRYVAALASEGIEEVARTAVIETQAAGVRKVFFRLLYPNGVAFSSSNMEYWQDIGISPVAVQQLLRRAVPVFETVVIPSRRDEVRVLYAMLSPAIIVQVGEAMENYSRFLDTFKGIFVTTMALVILLAAGVGWFMARRAVSGVQAVTRTARMISEGAFEKRVPVKARGDEVDQLAVTFNQMLDRVQTLLTELKEMTDNIAHDLKSPITRIRGAAEVTLTTGKSIAEFESLAASTVEECDRLLEMINTMLLISKAEAGVDNLKVEEIDLARVVRDACELFHPSAEDKNIDLRCDTPERIPFYGDVSILQRMLSNLLDNSIKYTLPGGEVKVVVSANQKHGVMISVSDTGIGVTASELPRIFERFYRSDRSRSLTGTGLGLSLARAIARAHGGDITVTSARGQGSTFTVSLPPTSREATFNITVL